MFDVNETIDSINAKGITNTYFEKALRIPFGSLKKWRSGKILPEEIALLKIIDTFPYLLEIADNNFVLKDESDEFRG